MQHSCNSTNKHFFFFPFPWKNVVWGQDASLFLSFLKISALIRVLKRFDVPDLCLQRFIIKIVSSTSIFDLVLNEFIWIPVTINYSSMLYCVCCVAEVFSLSNLSFLPLCWECKHQIQIKINLSVCFYLWFISSETVCSISVKPLQIRIQNHLFF